MDGLPVVEHLERLNETFVRAWWHWWFLGQTDKPAERVICADPAAWYRTPSAEEMGAEAHAELEGLGKRLGLLVPPDRTNVGRVLEVCRTRQLVTVHDTLARLGSAHG
jgi:hypothetical protein